MRYYVLLYFNLKNATLRYRNLCQGEFVVEAIRVINIFMTLLFFVCYTYQLGYLVVPFIKKHKEHKKEQKHKFAVLIAARNEAKVIGNLIESINEQTYGKDHITVFVIADNCTDNTADIARQLGAVVYERFDQSKVGKGYALDYMLEKMEEDFEPFDGYFVFDADNVLDKKYVAEMNKTFSDGYQIITSYRNSKNYDDNWISAGYALWFLRESKYLNEPRMLLGTSCAVSGTGFMFSRKILEKHGGWKFFLLTEDIEFTVTNIIGDERIGYSRHAVLYDEQPETFSQSWKQRLRWSKGYYQVFRNYGGTLIKETLKGRFSCFDMTMTILPALTATIFCILLTIIIVVTEGFDKASINVAMNMIWVFFRNTYLVLFLVGFITTMTEWKNIHAANHKKIRYMFTFPLFMLTYIPIALTALFKKVEWTPIEHKKVKTVAEIKEDCE